MAKKQLVIWFDSKGNMLDQGAYNATWASNYGYKSEDAKDFDDQMEFVKIQEFHQKSGRAYFKSTTTGRHYTMYLDDFTKLINAHQFINNRIEGTFQFLKKSSGQAVRLVLPNDPQLSGAP